MREEFKKITELDLENSFNQKIVERVKNLVEEYPNNMQLGKKVRELYWSLREDSSNKNQLELFDEIQTR